MPPPRTEVGAIAAAVDRVQRHPFPAGVRGAVAQNLRWLAPEMPLARRAVMANLWLLEPLLVREARRSPSLDASLRTTIAPTVIAGGVKENVIPTTARAVINFRILPGDSVPGVVEHVRRAVDDPHVEVRLVGTAEEPSTVSDPEAPFFRLLQRTIEQVFPEAVVAPYLTVGATDARHFRELTPNVYRFLPCRFGPADLTRMHGVDERVAVDDLFAAIRFYRALLVNAGEFADAG
jgi:carboxypeptidase PM20D1